MGPAETIRDARRKADLSRPALAERVGIPDSELAAYEAGTEVPDPETFNWIVSCARLDRGKELEALLELAEQFPVQHSPDIEFPIFPGEPSRSGRLPA